VIALLGAAVIAVSIAGRGAAPALAASVDQRSTASLIADARLYVGEVIAREGAVRRAGAGLIASIAAGCPALVPVDANDPSPVAVALATEAGDELVLAELAPVLERTLTFNVSVAELPWDSRLRRSFLGAAEGEVAVAKLPAGPPICADVRAAAATGFTAMPPDGARFIARVATVLAGPRPLETLPAFLASIHGSVTAADARAYAALVRSAGTTDAALAEITAAQAAQLNAVLDAPPSP
jgi:hypothetical protein